MNPRQALEWMELEFGAQRSDLMLKLLLRNQSELEAIVISNFSASNPKRQKMRIALNAILEKHREGK